jgi:hypothetical protein
MLTRKQAVDCLERLLDGPTPLRVTFPKRVTVLVAFAAWWQRLRVRLA